MSFFGDVFNSDKGAGYEATGVSRPQLDQAYQNTQSGLNQQQAFLDALAAQGGIANQGNVFQQQQALANQLQGIANGTGPNPALAQLSNTTAQNVAQQAALMAGQRGASFNPGLIARQIAQQGAATQQQAAGQAAVLRAQQQLAGVSALQQQQQMLGNLSSQQVGQQANALSGYNQAAQGQQQNLYAMQGNQNAANSGVAQQNAKGQHGIVGGLFNAFSSTAGTAFSGGAGGGGGMAHGGRVAHYQLGGPVYSPPTAAAPLPATQDTGPRSAWGRAFQEVDQNVPVDHSSIDTKSGQGAGNLIVKALKAAVVPGQGPATLAGLQGDGGGAAFAKGPLLAARGGAVIGEILAAKGKKVPGKAKVKGDSLKNDTVPAMLSPGEIIIPRSHAMDPDKAAAFARAVVLKNRKKAA